MSTFCMQKSMYLHDVFGGKIRILQKIRILPLNP